MKEVYCYMLMSTTSKILPSQSFGNIECLIVEIKIYKKKWLIFGTYNPKKSFGGTFFVGFIIEYLEKLNAIILIIYSSQPFNVVCEHQVFELRGSD